jgi:hypothetical protein
VKQLNADHPWFSGSARVRIDVVTEELQDERRLGPIPRVYARRAQISVTVSPFSENAVNTNVSGSIMRDVDPVKANRAPSSATGPEGALHRLGRTG